VVPEAGERQHMAIRAAFVTGSVLHDRGFGHYSFDESVAQTQFTARLYRSLALSDSLNIKAFTIT
jgi:hypothetical protein